MSYKSLKFPVGLALVTMANGRDYLFRVPAPGETVDFRVGSRVLCHTQKGEQPGVVSAYICVPDSNSLNFIMQAAGVNRLESVTAVLRPVPFSDTETYYRGKGAKVSDEPVTTSNARPGDPYITVHMPDGTAYIN